MAIEFCNNKSIFCEFLDSLNKQIKDDLYKIDRSTASNKFMYNIFSAQLSVAEENELKINLFSNNETSKLIEKIKKNLTFYKETLEALTSDKTDLRVTKIELKIENLEKEADANPVELLKKIEKIKSKINLIFVKPTDVKAIDLRLALNALECTGLSKLKQIHSPQLVTVTPEVLSNTLEVFSVDLSGVEKAVINVETPTDLGNKGENVVLNKADTDELQPKEMEGTAILLNNSDNVSAVEQKQRDLKEYKRAIEKIRKNEELLRDLEEDTVVVQRFVQLLKGTEKECNDSIIIKMPDVLTGLQNLKDRLNLTEGALCLEDVLAPVSMLHAPTFTWNSDRPDCLKRNENSHMFLRNRFFFHFDRLSSQVQQSEKLFCKDEALRAVQCLQVEFSLVYLYNFMRIENSIEQIRSVIEKLEGMKLHEKDLPLDVKNPAHGLFSRAYKDYLAEWNQENSKGWKEYPMWVHPHDPSFANDFGRNAFTGKAANTVKGDFKRKVINEFLATFYTTWGIKSSLKM